jgi:hypothetical protein
MLCSVDMSEKVAVSDGGHTLAPRSPRPYARAHTRQIWSFGYNLDADTPAWPFIWRMKASTTSTPSPTFQPRVLASPFPSLPTPSLPHCSLPIPTFRPLHVDIGGRIAHQLRSQLWVAMSHTEIFAPRNWHAKRSSGPRIVGKWGSGSTNGGVSKLKGESWMDEV